MFCKIKKVRNFLFIVVFFAIGFFGYQNGFSKDVVLENENAQISTKENGPAMILICDLNKNQGQSLVRNSMISILKLGKINSIFKDKIKIVAIINTDYEDQEILPQLRSVQRHHKFEMEFFVDHKNSFSKKMSAKNKPIVLLIKDGKVKYRMENPEFNWDSAEGIQLIVNNFGIMF
ncbi:hypothetical protein FZC35_00840 [Candidatus Cytomitobacter indipagum]|uniref:Alkyl hydroperoxide reductase subunit C/ Thiol specific antioxidant domain-containing protein n=1 Tax=Candidatus Cytomitobacter indipagum TaxID=2601575 RepID=A0A5C0UDU7_9PROT|nr:hypothetical protein [Candidatus Cytomitobacter indipagum]QEK37929.1 hypothetical protein FZC35_00840 [Candidatus Cytomitobacter indipagum]